MKPKAMQIPSCGSEKARRLWWATQNGGSVKVSGEGGRFVWIFERPTPFFNDGGKVFDACDFVEKAAAVLKIREEDVFTLDSDDLQNIARQLAGIHPQASPEASEADDAQK